MRSWISSLLFALSSCLPPAEARAAAPLDLAPEPARFRDGEEDLYRSIVSALLSAKLPEASCFQMVSLLDGLPESILFHDCQGEAEGQRGKLIYLKAERNIRSVLEKRGVHAALQIKVRRAEVGLSIESAVYLREVWLDMILRARPTQKTVMDTRRHYFFSACRFVQGCPGAFAENPVAGSLAARLVEVGQQLELAAIRKGGCTSCLALAMSKAKDLQALLQNESTK